MTTENPRHGYVNTVTPDHIMWCKPPAQDVSYCELAKTSKQEITVYIMLKGQNRLYGKVIIEGSDHDDVYNGKPRYKLSLVRRDSDHSPEHKRRRISTECRYKGTLVKSLLEANWAKFLTKMDLKWSYERITINLEDLSTYTPDFVIHLSDGTSAILEIKPDDPPDDAMAKCEETCKATGLPVYLFYKDKFDYAFTDTGRDYAQGKCIRAIKWTPCSDGVVMDESKYVWMECDDHFFIDKRRSITDGRYKSDKMSRIYAEMQNTSDIETI